MGSSYREKKDQVPGTGRERSGSPQSENINRGVHALLKDFKSLQQDGGRNGDLKFTLKDGHSLKAHSLIFKARYGTLTS